MDSVEAPDVGSDARLGRSDHGRKAKAQEAPVASGRDPETGRAVVRLCPCRPANLEPCGERGMTRRQGGSPGRAGASLTGVLDGLRTGAPWVQVAMSLRRSCG